MKLQFCQLIFFSFTLYIYIYIYTLVYVCEECPRLSLWSSLRLTIMMITTASMKKAEFMSEMREDAISCTVLPSTI